MLEDLVLLPQPLVQLQYTCHIPTPITIIRRTPYRDDLSFVHELEPLHRELMRPRYQVDAVIVAEVPCDVTAEEEAGSTR